VDKHEIKEKVIGILRDYARNEINWSEASESTNILVDLRVNSARFIDLVLDVEDEFEIEIEDAITNRILNIGDLIQIVNEKLNR
jgi:acyl carrier protein